MNEFICKYCGKECKNKNSLAQHEIRCKYNPNRISLEYLKYRDQTNIKRNPSNQFIKAKKLGLPIPKVSEETKIKISKVWKGRKHSEESKRKISKEMQRIVRENPESYSASNVNGRVKKVEYNGIILDSKWEVIVAKYLDSNNIEWTRPKIGFEYTYNETNKNSKVKLQMQNAQDVITKGSFIILPTNNEEVAKEVSMHAAAMRPTYVTKNDVPQEEVEKERTVLKEQAMNEGKPAEIAEKMVEGRLNKFYKEICLEEQPFVKDDSVSVGQYVANNGGKIVTMLRYEVGEGMQKREENFAEEVMSQINK